MAFTNYENKEINCKILLCGPLGAGKTENLRTIVKNLDPEIKVGTALLESLQGNKKPLFEFLPLSVGEHKGFHLKLHIFAFSNLLWSQETIRAVALKGIDGFIFIADSQIKSLAQNVSALHQVRQFLIQESINPYELPQVYQYNKRDSADILPLDILRKALGTDRHDEFEACAIKEMGVMETLKGISRLLIDQLATRSPPAMKEQP